MARQPIRILEDDLSGAQIARLLRAHLDEMHRITPAGSAHALDLAALRDPEVTFWSAWHAEDLLGCAALRHLDARSGEIKSMRTAEAHRGRGVASTLLEHIVTEALGRGYRQLYLETGSLAAFEPARALYQRHGFVFCGPFGDYREDPNNVFMTKPLGEPLGEPDG